MINKELSFKQRYSVIFSIGVLTIVRIFPPAVRGTCNYEKIKICSILITTQIIVKKMKLVPLNVCFLLRGNAKMSTYFNSSIVTLQNSA